MSRDQQDDQARVLEETALWLAARLETTEADLDHDPWIAADPARRRAARDLLRMTNSPDLDMAMRQADRPQPAPSFAPRPSRARQGKGGFFWPGAAVAASALVAVVIYVGADNADRAVTYRTARGESRAVQLDDGSHLTLGGDTAVTVSMAGRERHVELQQGAALFEVTRDPDRPFVVDAGDTRTVVLGTRFLLDRFGDGTELSVYSGRVRFGPPGKAGVEATSGQQVSVQSGRLGDVRPFEAAAAPWQSDWVDTTGMTLGRLVEELNRWSDRPVELADPALRSLQVSGYFRLTETESQLERIALLHRLTLVRQADKYVLMPAQARIKPL